MKILPMLATTVLLMVTFGLTTAFVGQQRTGSRRTTTSQLHMAKKRRNWKTTNKIGTNWDGHWERKYMELRAEQSWNPNQGLSYEENPRLWDWLHIQQENLRRKAMRDDRRDKLAQIGYKAAEAIGEVQDYLPPSPPPVGAKTYRGAMLPDKLWTLQLMMPPKAPPVKYSNATSFGF